MTTQSTFIAVENPRYFLTFVGVVVADVFDGVPHHLLVVHVGPRRDLSAQQHHASLTHRLCQYNRHVKLVNVLCDVIVIVIVIVFRL